MHADDETIGTLLTRRQALAIVAAGGAGLLGDRRLHAAAPGTIRLPACVARPAQTEGPYFLDRVLDRSDIRGEPSDGSVAAGRPLQLVFQVSRLASSGCTPLADAVVDVWQCDAAGIYSGFRDINDQFDTRGKQFLRGHQRTNADGIAQFRTIYPGWYPGRAVHIHFKIRVAPESERGHEFTSQVYFDEALTDKVHAVAPYAKPGRRTLNTADGPFRNGGKQLLLDAVPDGDGYRATFDVGLQLG
jgi:protocatechuate 3,4-dioxygenase beta subunit